MLDRRGSSWEGECLLLVVVFAAAAAAGAPGWKGDERAVCSVREPRDSVSLREGSGVGWCEETLLVPLSLRCPDGVGAAEREGIFRWLL